jgi:hypothetical protein
MIEEDIKELLEKEPLISCEYEVFQELLNAPKDKPEFHHRGGYRGRGGRGRGGRGGNFNKDQNKEGGNGDNFERNQGLSRAGMKNSNKNQEVDDL